MSNPAPAARLLRFGMFELDTRAGELRKKGARLRLRGQPLDVLEILLRRAGDVVTRDELRQQLWTADTFVDFEHSLHNAVARLRDALGDSAATPRYIQTLPRRGYKFLSRVEELGAEASPALRPRQAGHRDVPIRSLAVLPLADLSGDPAKGYLADGMTEALITSLAKVGDLRVISRTSAMKYKETRKSLPRIARELNVDAVLEGSVTRSGERVRITAQLIHGANDEHLWAESYERDFRDVLALQNEIAREVASHVRIVLTPEEHARLESPSSVDPAAHDLYLKARYHWNKRTEEGVRKALALFHRAIDSDSTFAQGYAGMADGYNILGYYNALPPKEAYPQAKASALKALELDPMLAAAHAALGVIARDYEWDWYGAEREFSRAIALNPGCVDAYHWRGTLFSMLGSHQRAREDKAKALSLDPLSVVIRADLGRILYFSGDYDQALEQYRAALDLDGHYFFARIGLAEVYQQKRLFKRAIAEFRTGVRLSDSSTFALARLGHGLAMAGARDKVSVILRRLHALAKKKYVSSYDIAMVHVGLHEYDAAFSWFEKALEERSVWLGYLKVEPQLRDLRADRRFKRLLKNVGLLKLGVDV